MNRSDFAAYLERTTESNRGLADVRPWLMEHGMTGPNDIAEALLPTIAAAMHLHLIARTTGPPTRAERIFSAIDNSPTGHRALELLAHRAGRVLARLPSLRA